MYKIIIWYRYHKINENLSKLESMDVSDEEKKKILKSSADEITSITDVTFHIMTALQF